MLQDCIEVFSRELSKKGDSLILDTYIPSDGTYMIVDMSKEHVGIITKLDIKYDKKTEQIEGNSNKYYDDIKFFDYNSRLIDMNKPIDGKKIIHSNNYLSFYTKKESLSNGKLTESIIDGYYDILKDGEKKYSKSSKSKQIYYNTLVEVGPTNTERIEIVSEWIKENIFGMSRYEVDTTRKDYLKLFFVFTDLVKSREDFVQEGKRYFLPNIYNSNDYNIQVDDKLYGLPNYNMGLNSKKPYLEHKTRGISLPYLLKSDEVLLQKKFADYLDNYAVEGKYNIYIDINDNRIFGLKGGKLPSRDFNGIYLRIRRAKSEVAIIGMDTINSYKCNLGKVFYFKNYLIINFDLAKYEIPEYGCESTLESMQQLINRVCFSKFLINNYFTEPSDMSISDNSVKEGIIASRDAIFNWMYKSDVQQFRHIYSDIMVKLIRGALDNNYLLRAQHLFNFYISLKEYFGGEEDMETTIKNLQDCIRTKINTKETIDFTSDEEYCFAVGQLINYFMSLNKGSKKTHSLANPFFTAKDDKFIKDKLSNLFIKYNYTMEYTGRRANNLYSMICVYKPNKGINRDMLFAGYLSSNLIYEKNQEEK